MNRVEVTGGQRHGAPVRIEVRALEVRGRHGVTEAERARPQPFRIDVDIEGDFERSAESDALVDTVDYGVVAAAAVAVVEGRSFSLVEALAWEVAGRILELGGGRLRTVTVGVHKLEPPLPLQVGSAGAVVTRTAPISG